MKKEFFVPDAILPSDNELEIPTLRLDKQPRFCDRPFVLFGEQRRTMDMKGTGVLHFYTDDYRFNSIYEHPEKIINHNPGAIIEPNFSLFHETPVAFGMQAVYKKRFIGRIMQDYGINVYVDLNVDTKFYKLNLIGIPRGYASFATRGYADRLENLMFEYELAKYIANGNQMIFVVYGGGYSIQDFCKRNGLIYVAPVVSFKTKATKIEKIKERLKETVSFFGQEIDAKTLLGNKQMELPSFEEMLEQSQVQDYSKQITSK